MKKLLFTVLIIFTILFTSCLLDPKDQYEEYPFKGKTYPEMTSNGSQLIGTYIVGDGYYGGSGVFDYGEYYIISLKSNNTCIVTYGKGPVYDYYRSGYYEGTYVDNGTTFTLNFGTYSYTGSKADLVNTSNLKCGFSVSKSNYNFIKFVKLSDNIIDTSYWQKSKLNIFCGMSNDFGETGGYRFLEDGTYYHYSIDGTTYKGTYLIYQNTIKFSGDIMYDAYNFSIIGGYILIGGNYYKII